MEPQKVLENMIEFSAELNKDERYKPHEMADQNQYIRIGGLGYRSVSLNSKTPLSGYSESPSKNLGKIFNEFNTKTPKTMDAKVREKKEERRLQRFIIKASLKNNRDMIEALSLTECPYDELIFATDEVSLGKIRCDILSVARIDKDYFPVVIELKCNRDRKIINQLNNFCDEIDKYKTEFQEVLAYMTGLRGIQINTNKQHKMLIWPIAPSETSGKKSINKPYQTREDIKSKEIHLLEYHDFNEDSDEVHFREFWA